MVLSWALLNRGTHCRPYPNPTKPKQPTIAAAVSSVSYTASVPKHFFVEEVVSSAVVVIDVVQGTCQPCSRMCGIITRRRKALLVLKGLLYYSSVPRFRNKAAQSASGRENAPTDGG